jgi:hypothetical protein
VVCVACAARLFAPIIGERWTKFDERSNAIAKSEWTGAGEGGNAESEWMGAGEGGNAESEWTGAG